MWLSDKDARQPVGSLQYPSFRRSFVRKTGTSGYILITGCVDARVRLRLHVTHCAWHIARATKRICFCRGCNVEGLHARPVLAHRAEGKRWKAFRRILCFGLHPGRRKSVRITSHRPRARYARSRIAPDVCMWECARRVTAVVGLCGDDQVVMVGCSGGQNHTVAAAKRRATQRDRLAQRLPFCTAWAVGQTPR